MTRRLLVVDDYEDTRAMLEMLFRHAGFLVLTAANGAQAVSAAKEHRPDAIVMDLFMPVMDGFEATRQIRADAELKNVPVIAYSGKVPSADEHHHLFDYICHKPCEPERLVAVVNSAVNRERPLN